MSEQILLQILEELKSINQRVSNLEQNQLKLETKIENEVIEKIRGLYDFREVVNDNFNKTSNTLEALADRIDDLKEEVLLNRRETTEKLDSLDSSIMYLATKLTQHDMQLFDLKRRAK
ncbi:hypothetical protein [Desulforamulus hydrothermalis]|uniref:Uncharacterized protein n=1 Tax=Desulforamulus hydrothermalis Lam5 = DSM 18033 TaxID=1121428 RepID=K8E051_9FIRM|nr:hypothetical protein [Desulforamulus hydrothermalis]CCO08854.1 conserved hypothetical protein [Desulforamulus hydrothermalis Lam5 = DSM 18033]SHG73258.1 hypothetical protein SAMN02745177_00169 [Desulforamulus hydrothermalis Lam5 = DSM 18033]